MIGIFRFALRLLEMEQIKCSTVKLTALITYFQVLNLFSHFGEKGIPAKSYCKKSCPNQ